MFFTDYQEAAEAARSKAREIRHAYGIEATREFGRKGFRVAMIPNDPTKRFGWEARCEVVLPTDPR